MLGNIKMTTNIEQASKVDHGIKVAVTATSSAASTSAPKISKFATKSGFVIPKNKLSGSLIPIYTGRKKQGGSDAAGEESSKQIHRKTKWGPDVTQDAAVRKGKALVYQTRVDQITKQLSSGILDIEDDPSSDCALNEKSELELERREAIGEILKLNSSYKAPADYKPLLREAKVPIPIKDYPRYNFITLVFGPANDTQKRLEKETGAKIRVFGTKSNKGKKEVAIDEIDDQSSYEDMYVHVCADTYEKVDAAVALIELLVKPVSVNPVAVSSALTAVSSNNVNIIQTSQETPGPYTIPPPLVNHGVFQPIGQAQPLGQFQQYPGPLFPTGSPMGFVPPQNSMAPILSNTVQVTSAPSNYSNMPSLFGPRPAGFGSVSQHPSFIQSRPQPLLQHPYMSQAPSVGYVGPPRTPSMPTLHLSAGQANTSAPPPFSNNPSPNMTGHPSVMKPLMPQPAAPVTFAVRSLSTSGSSSGWSQAPTGPSNMGQMALPVVSHQQPHLVTSQPIVSGALPFNVTSTNMVSPITSPFQPSPSRSSRPAFTSAPQKPQMGFAPVAPSSAPLGAPTLARPILPSMPVPPTSTLSPHPQSGVQIPVSGSSTPSATTASIPLRPSSNDFTFQPHRPQTPSPQMTTRPGIQPALQSVPTRNVILHPLQAPQISSFHPAVRNAAPQHVMQGFPGPQMSQPRAQMPSPPARNLGSPHALPRHPAFPNPGPMSPATPVPQIGIRDFGPGPQAINAAAPFQFRPGNTIPQHQNFPPIAIRPQGSFSQNQQFSANPPFPSNKPPSNRFGGQQNYDPFSPTSVPPRPQLSTNPLQPRKQENDPEYDDLMASVGVK